MTISHAVVSHSEWLEARKRFLAKEKEFTRLRDELSEARRALPWARVEKAYTFDGPTGRRTLAELFEDKTQLVIYHFMFGPAETQNPCKSCSFWADNFNGILPHLKQRDVNMVAVSRAPQPKLQAFAKRMGWSFPWYSSQPSDFNVDFRVSFKPEEVSPDQRLYNFGTSQAHATEMPGISVFVRGLDGEVFHSYSTFSRGIDILNNAYNYLDLVPKGRAEAGLPYPMAWLRYHDEY